MVEQTTKQRVQKARDGRIRKTFGLTIFFLGLVAARLIYLQVSQWNNLFQQSQRNYLRNQVEAAQRGEVLDCQGRVLASNRAVYDIYWKGSGNKKLSDEQEAFLAHLEVILESAIPRPAVEVAERRTKHVLIAQDVPFDRLCIVSEQRNAPKNLFVNRYPRRIYPYKDMASHVLGYIARVTSEAVTVGNAGIEKLCQEQLQGEPAVVQHTVNAKGERVINNAFRAGRPGDTVYLTLDFDIQMLAESVFESAETGVFIILDPTDGSLKALVSHPNFDPNRFLYPISDEEWKEQFQTNSPLLNRALNSVFPPASLFKVVTFTAGLEERIIHSDSHFNCQGYFKFCGRKYFCICNWGHGTLTAREALARSCNIPCFQMACKIKIDQFADYAHRFGLGEPTGCILPERSGLIPTRAWKKKVKGESWWKGETLSASIGQSYMLVTPLQVARMIGALSTGYLVKPRILMSEEIVQDPLKISPHTYQFLKESMRMSAVEGTLQRLKLRDFEVWGKTGDRKSVV